MEPKVYRDPQRSKIMWTAIGLAVLILVFVFGATFYLDRSTREATGAFTGRIIAKEFTPEPAQEITVGAGGLVSQRVEGEYLLKVQTPDGSRVFNVWVDKAVYDEFEVGDNYLVVPTP
jgi:hypothetical protein